MKRGFTLIELLAVIVILAIIALIATPTILNIIINSTESSSEISMDNLNYAVELYYQRKSLKGSFEEITFICNDGECKSGNKKLDIDGKGIQRGIINIAEDGTPTYISMLINGYICNIENQKPVCEEAKENRVSSTNNFLTLENSKSVTLNNYRIYGSSSGVGDSSGNGYVIPLTVSGKNIISSDVLNVNNWYIYDSSTSYYKVYKLNVKSNTQYTISLNYNTFPNYLYLYKCPKGETFTQNNRTRVNYLTTDNQDLTPYTFLTDEKYDYYLWLFSNSFQNHLNKFNWIQLETGTEVTTYEPYVESKTFNIILSSPLMEGDYIDFETQMVVRSNGTIESISIPMITTLSLNTNILEINTSNTPSKIESVYLQ